MVGACVGAALWWITAAVAWAAPAQGGRAYIQGLQQALVKIRGLQFLRPVPSDVQSKSQMLAFVSGELSTDYPPSKVAADNRMLTALGFAPAGFDIRSFMLRFYEDQVGGYYDPKGKKFHMVQGATGGLTGQAAGMAALLGAAGVDLNDVMVVHELDHALQDQHFNLISVFAVAGKNDDRALAIQALVEGDAYAVMFEYMMQSLGGNLGLGDTGAMSFLDNPDMSESLEGQLDSQSVSPVLDSGPLFMKRTLLFQMHGIPFILYLYHHGGWTTVNQAYRYSPQSTEQILHPEKFLAGDPPVAVSLGRVPAALSGWQLLETDTLGELGINTLAEQYGLGTAEVGPGNNWGGDTYQVYANGAATAIVWMTAWDTEAAAADFQRFAGKYLQARFPGRQPLGRPSAAGAAWTTEGGANVNAVGRGSRKVLVVMGIPKTAYQAAWNAAWK